MHGLSLATLGPETVADTAYHTLRDLQLRGASPQILPPTFLLVRYNTTQTANAL